jgi:pilus assembly protein CpaB
MRKGIIPLIMGLAIGLVAVKFGVDALKRAQASGSKVQIIEVVRAARDISDSLEITPDMVELVETTANPFAPEGDRIEKLEDAIGRVLLKDVPQGSPLLLSQLAPKGTPVGMEGRIPQGYRAVSVKIDEVTGVAFQLKPGAWVDVIVVMDVESGNRRQRKTVAEVILQRIQVVAIGQADTGVEDTKSRAKPAKSATLLVPQEDAPKLHLAATRGKITLTMRGTEDGSEEEELARSDSDELLAGIYGRQPEAGNVPTAPSQVALARDMNEPHEVTVYKWSTSGQSRPEIEQITFENADSQHVVDAAQGSRRPRRLAKQPTLAEDDASDDSAVDNQNEDEDAE